MFTTIKSFTFAASVSLLALTSATAAELPKVSEISVDASYDAAQDSNAAALYPELQTDINKAVAEMVPTSDDAADPIIRIDIRKIALDGDTYLPDSAEFNQIEGVVAIEGRDGSVSEVRAMGGRFGDLALSGDGSVVAGVLATRANRKRRFAVWDLETGERTSLAHLLDPFAHFGKWPPEE